MNVLRHKDKLLVSVPEADMEIRMHPDTKFTYLDLERTWTGTYLFVRMGEQAFHTVSTDAENMIANYDYPAMRLLRAILGAERAARRDGVPQVVTYRHGQAFFGPVGFRQPGEPWVEVPPDGIPVWHNEE